MPVLNKCCCWLDLRTGGMFLGVVTTVFSLICVASSVVELIYLDETPSEVTAKSDDFDYDFPASAAPLPPPLWAVIVILAVVILANIGQFVASIFLVIGAKKNRKDFILPYLVCNVLAIFSMVIYILSNVISEQNSTKEIVSAVVYLVIAGYLWLCVFSLYQWIKDTNQLNVVN